MDGRWRVELMGRLRLCRGDGISLPVQGQKATVLLAYLAYHGRQPHSREGLIELLWPEADLEEGRHNLRNQLHLLRELLGGHEGQAQALLIAERSTVHLAPGAFSTDVAEFQAALKAAAQAAELSQRVRGLEAAVALYRGSCCPATTRGGWSRSGRRWPSSTRGHCGNSPPRGKRPGIWRGRSARPPAITRGRRRSGRHFPADRSWPDTGRCAA
jgi:hypothetical protein